jgi:hypothetical protein
MTNRHSAPTDETVDFWDGVLEGTDPQPVDDKIETGRESITQKASPWANNEPCATCRQTFREGDRVVLGEHGVQHLDPALGCAVARPADAEADETEARELSAGLLAAWPPGAGVQVVTLTAADWQVARPGSGRKPPACFYCGATFRVGETVVICPCRPGGADPCGKTIHRDPSAGLPCWESWLPTGVVTLCPLTHTIPDRRTIVVIRIPGSERDR